VGGGSSLMFGELVIDEATYTARVRGRPLEFTYKEFEAPLTSMCAGCAPNSVRSTGSSSAQCAASATNLSARSAA
jgi:hypothetical protein